MLNIDEDYDIIADITTYDYIPQSSNEHVVMLTEGKQLFG